MTDVKMFARVGGGGRLCTGVILNFSRLPFPRLGLGCSGDRDTFLVPGGAQPHGTGDIAVP